MKLDSKLFFRLLLRCGDIEANPGPAPGHAHEAGRQGAQLLSLSVSSGKHDKCELQVMSLNVRGLCDSKKLRHLVNTCYKKTKESMNSLFLFQEVFAQRLSILNYLWRGDYHLTPGTGNSQGCLTLLTSPFKIAHVVDLGNRGHVLVLTKDDPNQVELIVANAYAPNGFDAEKLTFFEELTETIAELTITYNCTDVILAGDVTWFLSHVK